MLKISDDALEISNRFFFALELLAKNKKIRGLQTFTRKHNINYGNMNTIKNNRRNHILKPEYLAYLCSDYDISCEWLLLGKGYMFKQKSSKSE